jgi:hypothetical protein
LKAPLSMEEPLTSWKTHLPDCMQTSWHFNKRGFVLFAWQGLLPWASPSFWAYTLEATTLKFGKALGRRPSPIWNMRPFAHGSAMLLIQLSFPTLLVEFHGFECQKTCGSLSPQKCANESIFMWLGIMWPSTNVFFMNFVM